MKSKNTKSEITQFANYKQLVLCSLLMFFIFAIDLKLPLGIAGGVFYITVVLFAYWFPGKKYVISFSIICSLLTIAGFYFSPGGGEIWKIIFNRALSIFAIWITSLLLIKMKRSEQKLYDLIDEISNKNNEMDRLQEALKYQNSLNTLVINLNSVLQKNGAFEFVASSALNMLCSQVDAQVGTIIIVIDGRLKRIAKHALSKLELNDSEESLNRGGLIKEVLEQRRARVLTDIPDNYLRYKSSIINCTPTEIHILPLTYGAKTIGVCELAFMKKPASLSIEFLNLATENIAARFLALGIE